MSEKLRCDRCLKEKNLSKKDNADLREILDHSFKVREFNEIHNKYINESSIIKYNVLKYLD